MTLLFDNFLGKSKLIVAKKCPLHFHEFSSNFFRHFSREIKDVSISTAKIVFTSFSS